MGKKQLILAAILAATTTQAQTPLSAEEFEAYTKGRTITYGSEGQQVGAETYLRNRRVRWAFVREECQSGYWFPQGEQICFQYEGQSQPQCWVFVLENGGLRADHVAGGSPLFELPLDQDLICAGPDVGV